MELFWFNLLCFGKDTSESGRDLIAKLRNGELWRMSGKATERCVLQRRITKNTSIPRDPPHCKRKQLSRGGPVLCGRNYESWNTDAKNQQRIFGRHEILHCLFPACSFRFITAAPRNLEPLYLAQSTVPSKNH